MYSIKTSPVSSFEMDDNTGLMPPDNNANGSSSNDAVAADDKSTLLSQEQQQKQHSSCSEVMESQVKSCVSDINIDKVTTVSTTTWTNSDSSDTETLAQADHRDLQPGTRTEVSPLMKMALSKQRAVVRAASNNDELPASKKVCQTSQSSAQTGRLGQ